jgi:hypothetical protein
MSELVAVRMGMSCPDCMGPLPLNRIAARVMCQHCLSWVDVDWPANLFGRAWTAAPRTWAVGKRDQSSNVSLAIKLDVERIADAPEGTPRATDALIERVFPGTRRVIGETDGGDPTAALTSTLVTSCMSCGGGLKVDGSSRVVECSFCHDSNFLGDALWLRLHPALKRRWLTLVY